MNWRLGRLKTYVRLGALNIARVAGYRLWLKSGLHPVQRCSSPLAQPPFFGGCNITGTRGKVDRAWDKSVWMFGWYPIQVRNSPPDWFANPFSDEAQPSAHMDWWRISDFGAGDIKGLWELSRMDWVLAWATTAAHGDMAALKRLNQWVADWAQKNPPYKGPNWKCGQEASIRVMHLVTAAWVLGQARSPESGLVTLVSAHLQRIAPTISYAIGQQNNHGTSEAAALFIGGSFLKGFDPRAHQWERKGRQWLEKLAAKLIEPDGSFSQYSVTYHRLMLDTYSLAESWRRRCGLPVFSERLRARLEAATNWLWSMIDTQTGDAPNIGANDGAWLLQFTGAGYRDFRPSVQLAAALFENVDAFGSGDWAAPLRWLGVETGTKLATPSSQSFEFGGFHVMRTATSVAVLRYPKYRFRPSQADALHLDFWHNGVNLLRDAGTFSYNDNAGAWFSGTAAHNTVAFNGRDQMPRFGRFLFGDWLEADEVECVQHSATLNAAAAYTDAHGAKHHRSISLGADTLVSRDTVSGSFENAILRWRLTPDEWSTEGDTVRSDSYSISIEVNGMSVSPTFGVTLESRFYQHKAVIPEITVKVSQPSIIVTRFEF